MAPRDDRCAAEQPAHAAMRELCGDRNRDLAVLIQVRRELLHGRVPPARVVLGVRHRHRQILDAPAGPDDRLFLDAAAPLLRDIDRLESWAGKGGG
jgi:hypothetical protein